MASPLSPPPRSRAACEPPPAAVRGAVRRALEEDLGPLGDLTSVLVPPEAVAAAAFISRGQGVVAGVACAEAACRSVDPALEVSWSRRDGDVVRPGDEIGLVAGRLSSIVTAERTALNFLCHLSGVASATRRYVDAAKAANPMTRVLDTRKTTPGLRALEKAAVRAGGGTNHRGSLSDAVLVKDNHLGATSITRAVRDALERWPGRMVEVECDRIEQVAEALDAGATVVLCDNMSPGEVAAAVRLVEGHPRGRAGAVLVEASGGITLETIGEFAAAGAHLVSIGALTHSAPILDIGLDLLSKEASGDE